MKKHKIRSLRFSHWLLCQILKAEEHLTLAGDFAEISSEIASEKGLGRAFCWYWSQIIKLIPVILKNTVFWGVTMFRNHLKIAFRILLRKKSYAFINITGLAIGIAACIFILLWVQDELSFDSFHEHIDDIHIVGTWQQYGAQRVPGSGSPSALSRALKTEYPEVTNTTRMIAGQLDAFIRYQDTHLVDKVRFADSSLFEIFSFPFVKGSPATALANPRSMVMTEAAALKYFGSENPMGETVTINKTYDYTITGILKNIPHNSSIVMNIVIPLDLLTQLYGLDVNNNWTDLSFLTLAQVQTGTDIEILNQKIRGRIKAANPESNSEAFLYPLKGFHIKGFMGYGRRVEQVRMFALISAFILLIACINFINLSTARSGSRAREVGMRKVVGAQRKDIIRQFFMESTLFSLIALIFALILVALLLPFFSQLTGKSLGLSGNASENVLMGIITIAVLTGILAGTYPAVLLSAFKPARVLKGNLSTGAKGGIFRKILVVFQFAISIALIIGTMVVYNQVQFLKTKNLGLSQDQVVYIPIIGSLQATAETAKTELLGSPDIQHAALSSHVPTGVYSNGYGWDWEGKAQDTDPQITFLSTGLDYLETFQMEMAQGRFFSPRDIPNSTNVVINETFARIIGFENPIGKRLIEPSERDSDPRLFTIIGVIKDFHFKPLNRRIEPIILFYKQKWIPNQYLFMRTRPDNMERTLAHIEKIHKKFNPDFPFDLHFLDEEYAHLYGSQSQLGKIVRYFAGLAIFISCLGLFGLASFMAEQRTKEIGIRKVHGASTPGIVLLLTREFSKWVLAANLIAWPMAYLIMHNWLNNYPYRTVLGAGIFLFPALATLAIALLTVSYESIKAAMANPVDALKYE